MSVSDQSQPVKTVSHATSLRLGRLLTYLNLSEETVLMGTAIVVGIGTGIGSILFSYLAEGVAWVSFEWVPEVASSLGRWYVIIMPGLGGLLAGVLIYNYAREAKGHGVPEVMEAIALRGGRIRPIVVVIKALASSITIGTGGSVGREGPIVQIGSALGSTIGQALHLSDSRIRNLVACGAAGGVAAIFNAPIAGVFFALEVILGEFSVGYFSTVVVSAVVASIISRSAFGNTPAFPLPIEYVIHSRWEFLFFPVLGACAALIGALYTRMVYFAEDMFDAWKGAPEWLKPAIGGIMLGALALAYPPLTGVEWETTPHIFNVGYEVIASTLANEILLGTALLLMFLKLIATSLTLGSGGSGGIFAPGLFIGAMLGSAFQIVVERIFPGIPAPPGAYALLGMAAIFAASTHAPITAIIMLSELTDNHHIVLPLMVTTIVATLLSRRLLKNESIYTLKLSRRGIRLHRGRDVDVMQSVLVNEVMTSNYRTVTTDLPIEQLSKLFNSTHHHGFPVLDDDGSLWGIVTITDLDRAINKKLAPASMVTEIGTPRSSLVVAYPDEPIGSALVRLGARGLGRMPVVARENPNQLLGIIRRSDIIQAYNMALTRRTMLSYKADHMMARNPDSTEFVEITLTPDCAVIGKTIREIAATLPEDCILISVQRDGAVLIPHGDTVLRAADHITAFSRIRDVEALRNCF